MQALSTLGRTISYCYGQLTELGSSLCGKIAGLATEIFLLGVFAVALKNYPYNVCFCVLFGLAFPQLVIEKTALIFEGIFYLNPIQENTLNQTQNIWTKTKIYFDQYKPLIVTGAIAFFALPVVTYPAFVALVSLHLGAYRGIQAVNNQELEKKYQWLFPCEKKQMIA